MRHSDSFQTTFSFGPVNSQGQTFSFDLVIQLAGTWPTQDQARFAEVIVRRSRISHKQDGSIEIPSATTWKTPHQLAITDHLRDVACDLTDRQSAAKTRREIGDHAGQDDLLGRSTMLELVHRQGEQLVAAERHRAEATLTEIADDQ